MLTRIDSSAITRRCARAQIRSAASCATQHVTIWLRSCGWPVVRLCCGVMSLVGTETRSHPLCATTIQTRQALAPEPKNSLDLAVRLQLRINGGQLSAIPIMPAQFSRLASFCERSLPATPSAERLAMRGDRVEQGRPRPRQPRLPARAAYALHAVLRVNGRYKRLAEASGSSDARCAASARCPRLAMRAR